MPHSVVTTMPNPVLTKAIAHLEAAAELSPRNARYRATLGEALLAAGNDRAAERHLGAASNLGCGARVEALWALSLLRAGATGQAAAVVDEALRRQGEYAHGLYVRALCSAAEGETPDAVGWLRRAAKIADDPEFYIAEEARIRARGAAGAEGLARPLSTEMIRRFLRGAADLRRTTGETGETPTC
jgi:tetratricopeptide (TPR) repeat protein